MRSAFIQQLAEEARLNPRIFLVVGDLGYSVVEPFQKEFPNQFLNVGVAEQNMTGVAAGLAREGYTVFTYSIGNFPTMRCMEQVRYDVCYHGADVKMVAVGGGYAYGPLGPSHHATEDLGMLRTLPGLAVIAPGDPIETRAITSMLARRPGPGYLRLGKAGEPAVHPTETSLAWGEMKAVHEGTGTLVLTTGAMLKSAFDFIGTRKLPWGLWSVPFIKPLDLSGLLVAATRYERIITLEEHQRSGGLGSAVLEGLNDLREQGKLTAIPEVRRLAIPDMFVGVAGSQDYLRHLAGLDLAVLA